MNQPNFSPDLSNLIHLAPFEIYGIADPTHELFLNTLHYAVDQERQTVRSISMHYSGTGRKADLSFRIIHTKIPKNIAYADLRSVAVWANASFTEICQDFVKNQHQVQASFTDFQFQDLIWRELQPEAMEPPIFLMEVTQLLTPFIIQLTRRFEGTNAMFLGGCAMNLKVFTALVSSLVPLRSSPGVLARLEDEIENNL